jgi:hypothetical protein
MGWMTRIRFPTASWISLHYLIQDGYEVHSPPYSIDAEDLFLEIK